MRNIDKQALRDSAESILCVLENIAGFEPSDIDGDNLELRFETEDGFDTGCDVSIVDQCQRAVEVVRALLDELEAAEKRIAELETRTLTEKPAEQYQDDSSLIFAIDLNDDSEDYQTAQWLKELRRRRAGIQLKVEE